MTFQDKNDQPILEPAPGEMRLWDDITLVGLFAQAHSPDELAIALHLAAQSEGLKLPDYELRILADAQWERAWMQDYHPMQFGPRLWVCPSHSGRERSSCASGSWSGFRDRNARDHGAVSKLAGQGHSIDR